MLVLNDSQALIVENLLIRMLAQEPYSVQQLEEAIPALLSKGMNCELRQPLQAP